MTTARKATLRSVWWKTIIKNTRYCQNCGARLRHRYVAAEGRKRHVCPSCGQITYVNPKVVAGLIPVTTDGRILLLKRSFEPGYGRWTYPAGYQEMGESSREAALRETREEVGVRPRKISFLGVYSYHDAGVVTIVYVGKLNRSARPKPGAEALAADFFEPAKIPWKKLAFRSTKDPLKNYIRGCGVLKSPPKHGKPSL
jgi:ADP-ribose pyrophosphatase YjhB (NUDIX family)